MNAKNLQSWLYTLVMVAVVLGGCAGGDAVRLLEDVPIESPDDLSPPIVHEEIYQCARAVQVTGFAPDAEVQVYVDLTEVVGQATPHFGFTEIQLTRSLEAGESITATQTVTDIESAHSLEPVTVQPLPEFTGGVPPAPAVGAEVYECGRIVPVGGLLPGVRVFVDEDGSPVGWGNAADTWKAVWTSPLNGGGHVTAVQIACNDVAGAPELESPPSQPVAVRDLPDPFLPPVLDESTVVVGNNSVTLEELYVGARVAVFDENDPLASGYANSSTNRVPLPNPIEAAWSVRAEQELCETRASTDPVAPGTTLPEPVIVGPVCATDTYVRVAGTVVNATVVLLRNGGVAGLAGATPGDLLLPTGEPFQVGDVLAVKQYMGQTVSGLSSEVTVCECSDTWLRGEAGEILAGATPEQVPVDCGSSAVPVFQNSDPFDVLEVTLRADFYRINGEPHKDDAKSPGTLTYIDPVSGLPVAIDCSVEARGHSRFEFCEWRPLKIVFDGNPDGTVFDGTGKVIKIVTHCEWDSSVSAGIQPGTPTEDRRRLMQEFALYQVLETVGTSALETRLAHITFEDPSGTVLETEYGFFREREKRAAERCGFERLEADEGDLMAVLPSNPTSLFQVQFHHKFLFSHDFDPVYEQNVIRMLAPDGEEHYMAYDFDLSGVIHPSYFRNNDWSIEENGDQLIAWLEGWPDQNLARVQVAHFLQHEDEMRHRVQEGLVDPLGRARLEAWLEDHIRRLKCFLN